MILGGSLPLKHTGLTDWKDGTVNLVDDVAKYFKQNNPANVVFVIMA